MSHLVQQVTLSARAWAGLFALASIWGFSFLATRIALDEIGPVTMVAFRIGGAALVVWAVMLARGRGLPRDAHAWLTFLILGVLNNVAPFLLITFGQQHIETGLTSILNASTAIWGVLVAALLLPDERISARKITGVLLGFAGVTIAIGIDTLRSLDLRSISQLAVLAAALCYALSGVVARKRLRGMPPDVATLGMLTCSGLITVVLALVHDGPPQFPYQLRTVLALLYAAVIATALAYLLYYKVLALAGSGNTMLTTLLVAPVAIVAGALVLGETLAPRAYAGFALVALGLAVLDGRLWSRIAGAAGPRATPRAGHEKPLAPPPPPR